VGLRKRVYRGRGGEKREKDRGKPHRRSTGGPGAKGRTPGEWFNKLVALQARLRGPGGCPWDREQTPESLRTFLIEEAYETLEALEGGDPQKFASELGDLLLQIVFHSLLAQEAGKFGIEDVVASVHDKMVRRHPHVFGSVKADTSAEVLKNWEQLKAQERSGELTGRQEKRIGQSTLDTVPRNLPALLEAYQISRKAAKAGFDWQHASGIVEKVKEEALELNRALENEDRKELEEEVGDLFFAAVNLARFLEVDPEVALKSANRKFKARFQWMERQAAREGQAFAELPRERMEELWNQSKDQQSATARATAGKRK
jgi:tetrapyrrole methylase family protein / MazG family protein